MKAINSIKMERMVNVKLNLKHWTDVKNVYKKCFSKNYSTQSELEVKEGFNVLDKRPASLKTSKHCLCFYMDKAAGTRKSS